MGRTILFFTQSQLYGGVDAVLIELLRAWPVAQDRLILALNAGHPGRPLYEAALGGRVELAVLDLKTEEESKAGGKLSSWLGRPRRIWDSWRRFDRLLREKKPDALLVSSGGYPLSALAWRLLWTARCRGQKKVVVAVHNYPPPPGGLLRCLYLGLISRWIPLLCARMVSVSADCARALERAASAGRPVGVILNGLSQRRETLDLASKRKALGAPDGPLIGAIGNLERRKGFAHLIAAMREVLAKRPDASLVIIGADSEPATSRELRELAARPELAGRVRLCGFLPDAGQYAECFDICAIPSISHESFGLLALEAMRYAKPVVATRLGGIPEVVADGQTGLLVPPGEPGALAQAILTLLSSPETRKRLGENGRRRSQELFTVERMARDYEALLR